MVVLHGIDPEDVSGLVLDLFFLPVDLVDQLGVIEDDYHLRRLYSRALKKAGYEVEGAGTIQEARDVLNQVRFDLLLCDIQMGDGYGTDLVDEYSAQLYTTGAQVVMVSGQSRYREKCNEMGVDFFLEKPVAVDNLVKLVDRLTARHSF